MYFVSVLLFFYSQYGIAVQGTSLFGLLYGVQRVCLCRCGIPGGYFGNSRTGRVNGDPLVTRHEYPWLAAVNIGSEVVTGSLVSDRHVLTAASPFHGLTPERIIVTLGAHDRCSTGGSALNVSVESITLRPGYTSSNLDNDLALIKLKHVVAFSRYISPICLPVFGNVNRGQVTWIAGWSQNNVGCTPHVAVLPTLPSATCFKDTSNKLETSDKGCLGPLGVKSVICKSDVGAPVMTRWSSNVGHRLIGVISTSSCDEITPPLFTRVIDHVGWIYEHIRRDCQCF